MKKYLPLLILTLAALTLLAACAGGSTGNTDTSSDTDSSGETHPQDTDGTTPPAESDTTTDTTADTVSETEPETAPEPDTSPVEVNAIYPTPTELTVGEGVAELAAVSLSDEAEAYAALLEQHGIAVVEGGLPLSVTFREMTELSYGADEGYVLTVTPDGVRIEAQTDRGAYYAFMTLFGLLDGTRCPAVVVKDSPRNPLRGVIEGFYGAAYSHEYRQELFAFMGVNKMNAYIYAPKDDAKHRAQWRTRYTKRELTVMQELVTAATENRVRFVYAISPGGDIDLGAGYEADLNKLMDKCQQLYDLGVRDFAIFLDDILTLDAEGHAGLLNDFQAQFVETHEGVSDLIAITTEYCDPMLTAYTDRIAPLISKDITLMWTGPGVVPATITNRQLRNIIKKYDRNVLIWWNYPVNDVLVNNLYMGACEGLAADLYESITGLTANPMNQGYASLVPLFTTGDYLWNPTAYAPEASLEAACRALMPDASDALLHFIRMTCASPMNNQTDSVELAALLAAFKQDNTPETRAALKDYFTAMTENAARLEASSNTAMIEEIREWVAKYGALGQMGLLYIQMEEAYAEGKDAETLLPLLGQYKTAEASLSTNLRLVSTGVLMPFLNGLSHRFDQLLGLAEEITCAPATPYTNCTHYQTYAAENMLDRDDSTYFWTAGTLSQAAGGKVGYFGVDLGEVISIYNVYVATGMGGSDVLRQGILECSTDGKTWVTLYSGACKAETYLQDLSVEARYVRMRDGSSANTDWTKVRSFEVNTNRRVTATVIKATVTTNLPTYQSNAPQFMTDRDANTFFWSAREGRVGDYIQLDLGEVTEITRVIFRAGVASHAADYIYNGELCYSVNGTEWITICPVRGRETVADVAVNARYLRVNVKAAQTSWITVSEFSVVTGDSIPDTLWTDGDWLPRNDLAVLLDGSPATYLASERAEGHTLSVKVGVGGSVTVVVLALPTDGLQVTVTEPSGQTRTVTLGYSTEITAPEGAVIEIPLGAGLMLAEIQM